MEMRGGGKTAYDAEILEIEQGGKVMQVEKMYSKRER